MKLYRNAIILLVIVGLLLGTYFLVIKKLGSQEYNSGRGSVERLVDIQLNDITELRVDNKEGSYVFIRKGDLWELSAPHTFKIDSNIINSLAINISSLAATKTIDENATDLAQYGLSNPDVVTIKTKDGNSKVIEVGDQAPTRTGYYVKEPGNNKVYMIDSYTGEKIKISENSIRVKNLFNFVSDDVTAFSMDRGGKKLFDSQKVDDTTWTMDYPIITNIELSEVMPMIDAVTQSTVVNYIDNNATDLSMYGLDKPSSLFRFETAGEEHELILGKEKIKGLEIYAKLGDSNEVFTISYSPFTFVDKPIEEIMEVFVFITNISDVKKIVLEMDGNKDVYDIEVDPESKDKDEDKFYVNSKLAVMKNENRDQYFRNHYQALIGVTVGKVEPIGDPTGPADITITYTLKKQPGTMKVEYVSKDDRYYYAVKNGKYSGILVEKKDLDKPDGIRETYKALMEAVKKEG